jgi:hypothetical protein
MKNEPLIRQAVGIPPEKEIHAVIALGYSDEVYRRTAAREP